LLRRNEIHPGNLATSAFGQSPPTGGSLESWFAKAGSQATRTLWAKRFVLLQPIQQFLLQAQLNFSLESSL
jgi:hypothetical protein